MRTRAISRQLAILGAYAALAVGMTWPLASKAATHVVQAKWHYDSMVNIMILGSRVHHALGVPTLPSAYDNYFCAPVPLSIAYNESLFGMALLYAPFYLATRDPLLAYNLLLLLSLALSGYFAYLFARRISGSEPAAFLMGVAYAFCPYVMFELGRLQLVSAQWLPLAALFLHDAIETGRKRSVVALGLTFAMQVGSCLYYAFFLVLYGAFVGVMLLRRHPRREPKFYAAFAATAALVGLLVGLMGYPYVAARKDYPLTRSEDKAAEYSGRFSDLFRVYPENKGLPFLRDAAEGPIEPIAFPGFVLLGLAAVALIAPLRQRYGNAPSEERPLVLIGFALGPLTLLAAVGAAVAFGSAIASVIVFALGVLVWSRLRRAPLWPPIVALYVLLALLAFALFVGPTPLTVGKEAVRGLYFYLYHYVPGFDGIRYVSRIVILIMLALVALGAIGGARLLGGVRSGLRRGVLFGVLLGLMLLELRNAPVTLAKLPSRTHMPPAYAWLEQHKGPEPLAALPAYPQGYYGAREDYMALFHQRRTINGKSSWMPPVTHAFINESRRFPRRTMTSMLRTLGAKYVLVHTKEYASPARAKQVIAWMDARPEDYARRFSGGGDHVYELLPRPEVESGLVATPALPAGAVRVPRGELRALASVYPALAGLAVDGRPETGWTTRRPQLQGDWIEVALRQPKTLVAFEISHFAEAFDAPAAYRVSVAEPGGALLPIAARKTLRQYHGQVFHPRGFVFRVALPEAGWVERLRIEIADTVAGRWFSVPELTLWAAP